MFALPTLRELLERSRASFRANLKGSDAWIWPNNVYASAKVMAGLTFEVFGFASYISRQIFALTSDSDSLNLHGEEFGTPRRPAAPASGSITLTSTGDNLFVLTGAVFTRLDASRYIAIADASRTGAGTLAVTVISALDGKIHNAVAGTSLSITSGVTGQALAVVGASGIVGGIDVEDDETFRQRILFRKRNPPMGGSASDYVIWASSVSGVTRVFVERLWSGVGTVRVFPIMDDLYPLSGIPSAADVSRVAYYIETVRPSGAVVTVSAPTPLTINVTISGLFPNTPAVREAVVNELVATFRRLSRVAGSDTAHGGMPFLASAESFSRSWIWQAIANATGEQRHVLTVPAADVALTYGQMAVLGTVTFI